MNYEKIPERIYQKSFSIIQKEANLNQFPQGIKDIVFRAIHSCGMIDIAESVRYSETFLQAGNLAFRSNPMVFCDTKMTNHGIIKSLLPSDTRILTTIDSPETYQFANKLKTTRAAASIELSYPNLTGNIVVIGNAPTALFRLLELIQERDQKPGIVIAAPVGFVGAVESKEALVSNTLGLDYFTVIGRRGGSAIAASILNGLAIVLNNSRTQNFVARVES